MLVLLFLIRLFCFVSPAFALFGIVILCCCVVIGLVLCARPSVLYLFFVFASVLVLRLLGPVVSPVGVGLCRFLLFVCFFVFAFVYVLFFLISLMLFPEVNFCFLFSVLFCFCMVDEIGRASTIQNYASVW